MSEENKKNELKEEELEKVTGGENEYPDSAGYQYNGYNVVNYDYAEENTIPKLLIRMA